MTEAEIRPAEAHVNPWKVVEAFRCRLREDLGTSLKGLIVFGSLARGEWTSESDIDLVVLLDDALDSKAHSQRIWRLAWESNDGFEPLIEPLVFTEREYQRGRTPVFFNIRREGWFIMPEEQPSAVEGLLAMAREDLQDAEFLLERGSVKSSVSRAYYAMFNAAQAALLSRGVTRSRHSGVRAAFGYFFVRPGLVPQYLHNALERAHDRRLIADYSPQSVSREEAQVVVRDAQSFLAAVEELLKTG